MDSFYYKTYIHILFSEENSLICLHLEEMHFLIAGRHIFRMQNDP